MASYNGLDKEKLRVKSMDIQHRIVSNESEFKSFRDAVAKVGLPYEDLNYESHVLISYLIKDEPIGTGGLEIHDRYALLRSVSVSEGHRRKNIGKYITLDLINNARKSSLDAIYLLTDTAHDYFKRLGFVNITRENAPTEIRSTHQFARLCPLSAACMVLNLRNGKNQNNEGARSK
jgi:amino-acid N-acetyltransferase